MNIAETLVLRSGVLHKTTLRDHFIDYFPSDIVSLGGFSLFVIFKKFFAKLTIQCRLSLLNTINDHWIATLRISFPFINQSIFIQMLKFIWSDSFLRKVSTTSTDNEDVESVFARGQFSCKTRQIYEASFNFTFFFIIPILILRNNCDCVWLISKGLAWKGYNIDTIRIFTRTIATIENLIKVSNNFVSDINLKEFIFICDLGHSVVAKLLFEELCIFIDIIIWLFCLAE